MCLNSWRRIHVCLIDCYFSQVTSLLSKHGDNAIWYSIQPNKVRITNNSTSFSPLKHIQNQQKTYSSSWNSWISASIPPLWHSQKQESPPLAPSLWDASPTSNWKEPDTLVRPRWRCGFHVCVCVCQFCLNLMYLTKSSCNIDHSKKYIKNKISPKIDFLTVIKTKNTFKNCKKMNKWGTPLGGSSQLASS